MGFLKNWTLRLRYGKLKTAFSHVTVIAEGEIAVSNPDFETRAGMASFFTIHAWATDDDEALDMVVTIGRQVGFNTTGRIHLYKTDPKQPPGDTPFAYGLAFRQYLRGDDDDDNMEDDPPLPEDRIH